MQGRNDGKQREDLTFGREKMLSCDLPMKAYRNLLTLKTSILAFSVYSEKTLKFGHLNTLRPQCLTFNLAYLEVKNFRIFLTRTSQGIHSRPRYQLFILVAEFGHLKKYIYAVPLQTVQLQRTGPVLCVNPAHRQPDAQTEIGGTTSQ